MADTSNPFVPIPEVGDSMVSFKRVLDAMKQNMEILLGQRGDVGRVKQVIIYRQKDREPMPVGLNDGDQWWQPPIVEGEDWQLSIYWKGAWRRM